MTEKWREFLRKVVIILSCQLISTMFNTVQRWRQWKKQLISEWNVLIVTPYLENVSPSPVECMDIFQRKYLDWALKIHWLHAVLQIYTMQTWLVVHSSMFHHLNLSWIYGVFEQLMDIKQRLNSIQPQPSLSLIPLLLLSFITLLCVTFHMNTPMQHWRVFSVFSFRGFSLHCVL